MNWYEQGKQDYQGWNESKHYLFLNKELRAVDVMRLFLPPVPQDLMQMATPLPAKYREWLRGFVEARKNHT